MEVFYTSVCRSVPRQYKTSSEMAGRCAGADQASGTSTPFFVALSPELTQRIGVARIWAAEVSQSPNVLLARMDDGLTCAWWWQGRMSAALLGPLPSASAYNSTRTCRSCQGPPPTQQQCAVGRWSCGHRNSIVGIPYRGAALTLSTEK